LLALALSPLAATADPWPWAAFGPGENYVVALHACEPAVTVREADLLGVVDLARDGDALTLRLDAHDNGYEAWVIDKREQRGDPLEPGLDLGVSIATLADVGTQDGMRRFERRRPHGFCGRAATASARTSTIASSCCRLGWAIGTGCCPR
jgi:hypothetical protein